MVYDIVELFSTSWVICTKSRVFNKNKKSNYCYSSLIYQPWPAHKGQILCTDRCVGHKELIITNCYIAVVCRLPSYSCRIAAAECCACCEEQTGVADLTASTVVHLLPTPPIVTNCYRMSSNPGLRTFFRHVTPAVSIDLRRYIYDAKSTRKQRCLCAT